MMVDYFCNYFKNSPRDLEPVCPICGSTPEYGYYIDAENGHAFIGCNYCVSRREENNVPEFYKHGVSL